jgi:hypothetical protein
MKVELGEIAKEGCSSALSQSTLPLFRIHLLIIDSRQLELVGPTPRF